MVNGTSTYYTLNGSNIIRQKTGSDITYFTYDENGSPIYMEHNGLRYLYVKNLQGDVLALINTSGTKVVEYAYDNWGKLFTCTGSLASTIGQINPFRYRGYYYDTETGLYYLNSRYYDPETGRFINADGLVTTGQGLVGSNMYAYCNNNPVMNSDPSGYIIKRPEQLMMESDMKAGPNGGCYYIPKSIFVKQTISSLLSATEVEGKVKPNSPPPPESGYVPPKNPDKGRYKVPAPGAKGNEHGWLDKKGRVWVPDTDMDGGEGWRRHYSDGSHDHVYPNGRVRSHAYSLFDAGALGFTLPFVILSPDTSDPNPFSWIFNK